jgi:hypothetical protein
MRSRRKETKPSFSFTRLGILVLLLFLVVFLVGYSTRKSIWDGQRRFTIIIQKTDALLLFSIEPLQGKAVVLSIPGATQLEVPYGYKTYPAASAYRLGELDGKRGGGVLLKKSIEATLTLGVEGYWVFKQPSAFTLPANQNDIAGIKKTYFSLFSAGKVLSDLVKGNPSADTNIAIPDQVKLWYAIRALRSDQVTFLSLSDGRLLLDTPLADGTPAKTLDPDAFDTYIDDNFEDSQVRVEHFSVVVSNATNQEKLATQFGRILDHMGANLIGRTTSKELEKQPCVIYSTQDSYKESVIVSRLKVIYNCTISNQPPETQQADIMIKLGEGYIK